MTATQIERIERKRTADANLLKVDAMDLVKGDVLCDRDGTPTGRIETVPQTTVVEGRHLILFDVRLMKDGRRYDAGQTIENVWPAECGVYARRAVCMGTDTESLRYPVLFVVETELYGPKQIAWYETKGGRLKAETYTKEVAEELAEKIRLAECVESPVYLTGPVQPQVTVKPMGLDTFAVFVRSTLDVKNGTRGGYVRGLHGERFHRTFGRSIVASS